MDLRFMGITNQMQTLMESDKGWIEKKFSIRYDVTAVNRVVEIRNKFLETIRLLGEVKDVRYVPEKWKEGFEKIVRRFTSIVGSTHINDDNQRELLNEIYSIYDVLFEAESDNDWKFDFNAFTQFLFDSRILLQDDKFKEVLLEKENYQEKVNTLYNEWEEEKKRIAEFISNQNKNSDDIKAESIEEIEKLKLENQSKYNSFFAQKESQFNELKAEIDRSTEAKSKVLAKEALQDYVKVFDEDSERNDQQSFAWILYGSIIITFLFLFIILDLNLLGEIEPIRINKPILWTTVLNLGKRLIFLSIFFFLISYCFKQSRLQRHQYVLNKHRSNVLKSFIKIINGPTPLNETAYTILLAEVSKTIFEFGQSGYVNIADKHSDGPVSILEIAKSMNVKASSPE